MPIFTYRATKDGEEYDGEVDAVDRFAVYDHVREEGGQVVAIAKKGKRKSLRGWVRWINNLIGSVKTTEKIVLTRNLASMVDAGLSISRALSVMRRQSKNPKLQTILGALEDDVNRGSTLADALEKHPKTFSPLLISMVAAGEESGGLAESLRVVSTQMDRAYTLKRKIRGALIYPGIIITAMIVIGVLMLIYVVPTLSSTFEELGADLPASTQAIISTSEFVSSNIILLIAVVFLLGLFLWWWGKTRTGKRMLEAVIMHIPVVGPLVKETNAARTSRTLSSLLSSGVEVVTALSITSDVLQNSHYREVVDEAGERIQKGEQISAVFSEHDDIYPIMVGEMVAVGEETGKLSEMLLSVAEFYEDEVAQKTKDMSTIIEPFLMIVVGVGVGFFAISMISPIYSLSSSI